MPTVHLEWTSSSPLLPEAHIQWTHGPCPIVQIRIEPLLPNAYALYDLHGDAPPPLRPKELLTPQQLVALNLLLAGWPGVELDLSQHFPRAIRALLMWQSAIIGSGTPIAGVAPVVLQGNVATGGGHYEEHGVSAVLEAGMVAGVGESTAYPEPGWTPAPRPSMIRLRPTNTHHADLSPPHDPAHHDALTEEIALTLATAGRWSELNERYTATPRPSFHLGELITQEALRSDTARGMMLLTGVWQRVKRLGERLTLPAIRQAAAPAIVRRLVELGRFTLPEYLGFDEHDREVLMDWVSVGASLEGRRTVNGRSLTALAAHVDDLPRFESLLIAGASADNLYDRDGDLLVALHEEHRILLRKHRRQWLTTLEEAEAAARRPPLHDARSVAQDWLQRGWLELEDGASIDMVAAPLSALIASALPADELLDAALTIEGIEDLYVSEDEIMAFLDVW